MVLFLGFVLYIEFGSMLRSCVILSSGRTLLILHLICFNVFSPYLLLYRMANICVCLKVLILSWWRSGWKIYFNLLGNLKSNHFGYPGNKACLTLVKTGLSGVAHGWGVQKAPSLKSVTHILQQKNLAILYCNSYTLTKEDTKKIYKSRDTPLEFCWHQYFFNRNQQILLYQEIQI